LSYWPTQGGGRVHVGDMSTDANTKF